MAGDNPCVNGFWNSRDQVAAISCQRQSSSYITGSKGCKPRSLAPQGSVKMASGPWQDRDKTGGQPSKVLLGCISHKIARLGEMSAAAMKNHHHSSFPDLSLFLDP